MADPTSPQDRLAGLSREQRALLFEQVRRRKEKERAAAPPAGIPRRPPGLEPLPLSFAQERLWFIDRMQPGLSAYNMPLALRISGATSPAVFAALLGEVVRRHEVLRTTFREVDGQPVQAIAPAGRWTLPLVDLSAPARRAPRRRATARWPRRRRAGRSTSRADRSCAPSWCGSARRRARCSCVTMHHIVSDGWSIGVLVARARGALRRRSRPARPSPLPELPIQYADFAVWQRGWLRGEVLERAARLLAASSSPACRRCSTCRPTGRAPRCGAMPAARLRRSARRPALARRPRGARPAARGHPVHGPPGGLPGAPRAAHRRRTDLARRLADRQPQPAGDRAADRLLRQHPGAARRPHGRPDVRATCSPASARPPSTPTPIRTCPSRGWWRRCGRSGIWPSTRSSRSSSPSRTRPSAPWSSPGCRSPRWRSRPRCRSSTSRWASGTSAARCWRTSTTAPSCSTPRPRAGSPRIWRPCCAGAMADAGGRVSALPLLSPEERQQLVREWNDTGRPAAGALLAHEIAARQAEHTPDAVAVSTGRRS